MTEMTAPIGPKTARVNRAHWKESYPWAGLKFALAEICHRSIWGDDYHLRVPWMHPDDRDAMADDPEWWAYYRIRPKRGWRSFVKIGDIWHVSKAKPASADPNEPQPVVTILELTGGAAG